MKNGNGELFRTMSAMQVARSIVVAGGVLFFILLAARVLCFLLLGH